MNQPAKHPRGETKVRRVDVAVFAKKFDSPPARSERHALPVRVMAKNRPTPFKIAS